MIESRVPRSPGAGHTGWCLTVPVMGSIRTMAIILTCLIVLAACGKGQSAGRATITTTAPRLPGD